MLLALVGSIGTGLVWGWLLVQRHRRPPTVHRFGQLVVLGAATGTVALMVALMAGLEALASFLVATSVALMAHVMWLNTLRMRASSLKQPG